jgi:predicted Zn-dependent protease
MTTGQVTAPFLLALALVSGLGCATNPVTGKSEPSLISESQEISMGRQAAQEVGQSIGYYDDPKVQEYVSTIGLRMAAASERPQLPWEFHVVNDAAVNAFALPGGFIFVTRGLMTYVNNEAELATVIGHEIGHVTARHSVRQISKAQLAQLGLGVGSILSSDVASLAGIASQGLGLMFLKFGRDAETQADDLGFRYALGQNYDVREMASVFETLNRVSATGGGGRLPEWLSTHPNPENRIARTQQRLDTLHRDLTNTVLGRDQYLQRVQGMTFGEDPRQGYFEGGRFYHPELRFQLSFPDGWKTQNTADAVVAVSPGQDALVRLGLAGQTPPRQAVQQFLSQEGVRGGNTSNAGVNGLPASASYFEAQSQQGSIQGLVTFISYGGTTYGLLAYTAAGKLGSYDTAFRRWTGSFSELRERKALDVQPARVEIVKLPREMTLQQFNAQYPSTIPIEQLAIINEVEGPESPIPAGRPLKRVTGGRAGA